jgi:hypothetical protein
MIVKSGTYTITLCLALAIVTLCIWTAFPLLPCSASATHTDLPLSIAVSTVGDFAMGESWYLSVDSTGQAELTISTLPEKTRRRFEISDAQLAELVAALEKERFFDLKDDYGDLVPDGSTETVTIVRGDQAKTVRVHFLMNWVHSDQAKLREPSRAVRILMLIRSWFNDAEAVDLTRYDQMVLNAVKD